MRWLGSTKRELRDRLHEVEGRQDEVLTALGMVGAILMELPRPGVDTRPAAADDPLC